MTNAITEWVRFDWPLSGRQFGVSLASGYTLRAAGSSDLSAMRSIVRLAYETDPVWSGKNGSIETNVMERVEARIADPTAHFVLAECSGQVVGLNGVAVASDTQMNLITGICVAADHQGRGLGRALLGRSLEWLRDQGLSVATVTTDNRAVAAHVYRHFDAERVDNVGYPGAF